MIYPSVFVGSGQDAQRHADERRDEEAEQRQFYRRREDLLEVVCHRAAVHNGFAQIALEQVGVAPGTLLATDGKRLFVAGYGARAQNDLICYELDTGRRVYCTAMPREPLKRSRPSIVTPSNCT